MMNRIDFIVKTAGASDATLSYSQLYAHTHQKIERTTDKTNYDVIVIGVGSMGASTC
jgi:hypothetical protein